MHQNLITSSIKLKLTNRIYSSVPTCYHRRHIERTLIEFIKNFRVKSITLSARSTPLEGSDQFHDCRVLRKQQSWSRERVAWLPRAFTGKERACQLGEFAYTLDAARPVFASPANSNFARTAECWAVLPDATMCSCFARRVACIDGSSIRAIRRERRRWNGTRKEDADSEWGSHISGITVESSPIVV